MENLAADFVIDNEEQFVCSFEVFASGTVWGDIEGDISDQTDLINILNSKVNTTEFNTLSDTVSTNTNDISLINHTLNTYGDIVTYDAAYFATAAQGALANTAIQPNDNISLLNNNAGYITESALSDYVQTSDLATVATTGDYDDLTNKPTIPTVGNGTIIINQGSTPKGTFTLNQSGDTTIDLDEGGGTVDQTFDSTSANAQSGVAIAGAGFVTDTVNNLANYYTKSETYTQLEVQQLIASIPQFSVEVVNSLPAEGERMVLYLVPKQGTSPDVYEEYIWVEDDSAYELLGTTAVDLSNYVTTSDLSTVLASYTPTADLATVATSGSYNDLSNKPIIPTVGNGTITLTQGGTTKGTFTVNQSGDTTIALDAGGGGGTVDQVYDPTSVNAQSGVAIAGAGFATNDDIISRGVTPSSKLFSKDSAEGYIETVNTYTFDKLNKADVIQKCGYTGSNYYSGTKSPFLMLYKDANNYFGIERQGYVLRLINYVNGTAVNTEAWSNGVNILNPYLNIYFSLDFNNKQMKIVGSNGTPTTIFTFDFSEWDLSSLDTFKIRTSGGKYAGHQYNVYLRLNDYYDYEALLNLKFQVNSYNTLPIIANGEGSYAPTELYLDSTTSTITSTHKTASVSNTSLNFFMISSGYTDLLNDNFVSSLVRFKITSGTAEIHSGAGVATFFLMDDGGNILYNGIGASENYALTNDTWYYLYIVGTSTHNWNYTRRYNAKFVGTFTIEAEALAIGYPRSMNCCAENFDGKYFTGTIPMTSYKTTFTDVTFTSSMSGYQAPIGAIYLDTSSNVMYIYNGTNWINFNAYVINKATVSTSLSVFGTAATVSNAINIGASSAASSSFAVAIGASSVASSGNAVALGYNAKVNSSSSDSTALGRNAQISANTASAIQLGNGTNSTPKSFCVGFNGTNYQLLDGSTGKIPASRIPIDGSTITTNASGQLVASGGGSITVDQTFDGTSTNAQSGVAIAVELLDYATQTDISDFVTSTDLGTTLADYVKFTDLSNYVETTDLNTILADYVMTTDLSTTLADYVMTSDLISNYYTFSEVNTLLDDKADNDLSNLTSTSSGNFDGQWVFPSSEITLANQVTWAGPVNDANYSLVSWLPSDSNTYEVLFSVHTWTDATSGKFVRVALITNPMTTAIDVTATIARTAGSFESEGCVTLPIDSSRTVTVKGSSSTNASGKYSLVAYGYRRIGTNS